MRIYKFDNLKFLLILLVVIGHFCDLYINDYVVLKKIFIFVYAFHMPLFIFVTGLFQKKISSYKEIPYKKILFYIGLMYFMKITIFLVSKKYNLGYNFEMFSGGEVYWYLGAIIIYNLLIPFINKINYVYLFCFSIIIGLFVGYDNSIGDYLYLSRAIVFFPFYLLGYFFRNSREQILKLSSSLIIKIVSFLIIILFLYWCFKDIDYIYKYRMLFTGRNAYSLIDSFVCSYKHRLFTYFISFVVGSSIFCVVPNRKIKIISNLGKNTLQVYVLHCAILLWLKGVGFFEFLRGEFGNYFIYVYLLIAVILTCFLSIRKFRLLFNYIQRKMFVDD